MEKDITNKIYPAQKEMSDNYLNGSIGIVVSGFIWLIASIVSYYYTARQGVWVLIIGGALIHPISIVINKILGVAGKHSKDNALGGLAMEGTIFMLMCIPLAYLLSIQHVEWFFQAMLIIIGGRYLTFNTIYGKKAFWILGGLLGIASYLLFVIKASASISAITGATIEILFGAFMYVLANKEKQKKQLQSRH
jgi:hypothetical protein